MDLLPEHTEDLKQDKKPEITPAKSAAPKVFDIFSPNKTAPPASSRPIIVSHKAMAKDTTVTGNKEILKQDNKEAAIPPPPEEHQQMLDTHKKVNLQPVNIDSDAEPDKNEVENVAHIGSDSTQPSVETPKNAPEYDRPLEGAQSDNGGQSHVEPKFDASIAKTADTAPIETEVKQNESDASPAAFSAPEHTDSALPTPDPDTPDKDELLIPAHTGGGYNEPVQDSEEQFNQFVVSHHKSARQKWLKKFGIIFAIVVIAMAILSVVIWKLTS